MDDGLGKVADDVGTQGATNYGWNEIGEMTGDAYRGLTGATWTVYGKIQSQTLSNGSAINYTYDATGNRISKTVSGANGYTEWYVRDGGGKVMSVYKVEASLNSGHLTQTEVNLYGNERLGTYKQDLDLVLAANNTVTLADGSTAFIYTFTRGGKFFELTDHRRNVLSAVSDKKVPIDENLDGTIDYYVSDVASAQDYSSFGVLMDGRQVGNTPRFTYNGKQLDKELGWQDYGMREYLGGVVPVFASVDPLTTSYPELTPYQFASNSPIENSDLDGAEAASDIKHGNLINVEMQIKAADFKQKNAEAKVAQQKAMLQSLSQQHATSAQAAPSYSFDEVERRESRRNYERSDAGYNPDGSKKPLVRLAENKTFNKLADNVVIPIMELDGAYGVYRMTGSLLARRTFANTIKKIGAVAGSSGIEFEGGVSVYTQGKADKFIILDRNQAERVDGFANELRNNGLNIRTITQDLPNGPANPLENGKWLQEKFNEGFSVIDIGLDPAFTSGKALGIPSFDYGAYYGFETTLRQTQKFAKDVYIPIKK